MFELNVRLNLLLNGEYNSNSIRVENNMVVLFSDLSMNELKVLPRDLQLYCDMATGGDSKGQYQWGDMVQLDAQSVGVIVRLERENFQVKIEISFLDSNKSEIKNSLFFGGNDRF